MVPLVSWIHSSDQLKAFCSRLSSKGVIGVDTEFIRTHTFWPEPCILQLSNGSQTGIIDLQASMDWAPLLELLLNPQLLKIFHSPRQDMEIFYQLWKILPAPIFDTQLAAAFMGMGECIGYEQLVQQALNINLDKSLQFSKWNKRPLDPQQIAYAAADVQHLPLLYEWMRSSLGDRYEWVQMEMAPLNNPLLYTVTPTLAWKRFKISPFASYKQLYYMHLLTTWRESLAQTKNIARSRILKDGPLWELCVQHPETVDAFNGLSFIKDIPKTYHEKIVLLLNEPLPDNFKEHIYRPQPINLKILRLLKDFIGEKAQLYNLPPALLASTKDLEEFLRGNKESRLFQGWRYDMVGLELETLALQPLEIP